MKRKLTYLVIAGAFACWTAAVGAQTSSTAAPGTGAGSPAMKGSEGIEKKGSAATANNPDQSGTTTSNTNLGHGNTSGGMSSGSDADRARIDADYRAARDACNGKTGSEKSDCLKDARKTHDEQRAEWRKSHPAMKHSTKSSHSMGSMGSDAASATKSSAGTSYGPSTVGGGSMRNNTGPTTGSTTSNSSGSGGGTMGTGLPPGGAQSGSMGSSKNSTSSMSSPSTGAMSTGNVTQCANMTGADKDKCMDALKAK